MIRYYFFVLAIMMIPAARSESVYYLHELGRCEISLYENRELKPVDNGPFTRVILNVRNLPKNHEYVAFKYNNQIYVTPETCVMSVDRNKINNNLQGNEFKKKPRELSEREKFNANKYFAEIDFGTVNLSDTSAVADYNTVFSSTSTTNPTEWGSANESAYSPDSLLSLAIGVRVDQDRFLALKLRMFNGKKSDELDLVDINTSISQKGTWTYEDSFKNLYLGYKFIFLDYSAWKPVFGVYIGVSQMSSTLSDGLSTYELTSLGIAALAEAGLEYHFNAHWGVGGTLGYEYLGKRNMKFENASTGTNFKSNMSYSNQYFNFGLKYYFK